MSRSTGAKQGTQLTTYDFTSFVSTPDEAKVLLREYCKAWVFQHEAGDETGKEHLQGRMHLKVRDRFSGLAKKFKGWHFSITSNAAKDDFFYVEKSDTRIGGPWSSKDPIPMALPDDLVGLVLRPWQQYIVDHSKDKDWRSVNIIIDKAGNCGKSTLAKYCGFNGIGRMLPFANDFRDLSRMVMDTPTSTLYLIDIPRGIPKKNLALFYAGIESLKNGYAFDDRYNFREKYFTCPNVWVFTNVVPDKSLLSADRWKFWEVQGDNLVQYFNAEEGIFNRSPSGIPLIPTPRLLTLRYPGVSGIDAVTNASPELT